MCVYEIYLSVIIPIRFWLQSGSCGAGEEEEEEEEQQQQQRSERGTEGQDEAVSVKIIRSSSP